MLEELLKQLVQVQKDYIKFLDGEIKSLSTISYMHGIKCSIMTVDQGNYMRRRLKELEDKIDAICETEKTGDNL